MTVDTAVSDWGGLSLLTVGLACALVCVRPAWAVEPYGDISRTLESAFPGKEQPSREYLRSGFVTDRLKTPVAVTLPSTVSSEAFQVEIKRLEDIRAQMQAREVGQASDKRSGHITLGSAGSAKGSSTATTVDEKTKNAKDSELTAQLDATIKVFRHSSNKGGETKFDRSKLPRTVLPAQGIPVQKSTFLVLFEAIATRFDIESVLRRHHLHVMRTVPKIGLVVVQADELMPATGAAVQTADAEKDVVRRLQEEPSVTTASLNIGLQASVVPRSSSTIGLAANGDEIRWDWTTGPGSSAEQKLDGNWWQKVIRLPAAWNFLDAIKRRGGGAPVKVGVVDVGFAPHEDLPLQALATNQTWPPDDHGNHVAGIIGARFGNGVGVDGGAPMADIVAAAVPSFEHGSDTYLTLSEVIGTLVDMIDKVPAVRVINLSVGYNWGPNYHIVVDSDPEIQRLVKAHGIIVRRIAEIASNHNVVLVSAAGNDSGPSAVNVHPVSARFASPFNWVALDYPPNGAFKNVVVVESVGRDGRRSRFSNGGGLVAAPGEAILSTDALVNGQPDRQAYGVDSGTSMAAPQISAILAMMFAYDPSLTVERAVAILERTAVRNGNGTPIVDAFAALLETRPEALSDLADLNGDGRVDMQDFLIFRDAIRQVEARGSITPFDLNGDGIVSANENVWPRADLNGSGRLERADGDARKIRGERMTDLDVMVKAWSDPGTPAAALRTLLNQ